MQIYTLTKKNNIVKIINTRRAYRNFLLIIESQALVLVQMYEYLINTKINSKKLFFKMIEKFQNHIKLRKVKKLTKNIVDNSTFSIFIASTFLKDKFRTSSFCDDSLKLI